MIWSNLSTSGPHWSRLLRQSMWRHDNDWSPSHRLNVQFLQDIRHIYAITYPTNVFNQNGYILKFPIQTSARGFRGARSIPTKLHSLRNFLNTNPHCGQSLHGSSVFKSNARLTTISPFPFHLVATSFRCENVSASAQLPGSHLSREASRRAGRFFWRSWIILFLTGRREITEKPMKALDRSGEARQTTRAILGFISRQFSRNSANECLRSFPKSNKMDTY